MQTTPVKKGRGVLMELPNGRDLSSPAKGEIKAEDGSGTAVVLEKKHPQIQVSVIPSGRPPLYCSPAIRRRSSLATNKPKRIRQSPSAKRVSFGGDTINIISQHPKEFRSPDADTPPGSVLSPSHKSRKLSHPSSPAARRSPAFVSKKTSLFGGSDGDDDTITLPARLRASPRPGPSLTPLPRLKSRATQREGPSLNSLLSDDVEDDDTVNLPKEPRVSLNRVSASMSRPPLPMTSPSPVPLRRSSVANARHSFGIFLDDDISRGQGDAALTDENDPPEFNEGVLSDGNEAEASDEDITRDLRIGMAIDKLLDSDESASADVATENESEHSVLPTVSPPAERPSQPSSRQSLGYISELPPLQDDCGGDDDITQRRCSMAPAVGHRAVIEDDSRSKRFSVHSAVQMGDILHQIEQDEQDDDVTIHFPSAQQQMTEPERSPVAYAVETIEHDKSGKSGKEDALKQYQVGEEETEDRADAIQRDAVSASVRDTDVTSQAVSPHESEVIPGALSPRNECNKELSEDLVDRRTTSENHIKSSPSCNIAQPPSRSPLKEQRKLFESDDTETLHFHSTNPNQKKTSASDNSPAKAKNGINAAKGVDQVSNGVETSSADDNKPPVEKMSDSSRAANAAIQDRDTLEPPTTNTMVTPRSET
ncbi:unnamed protein product [Chondrus crispus]|uniref:Uncharacterized protein n=1 Tax=Chondrus crispus TaxID=2769 RepID=R7QDF2_CHOCR|nr:unnamed protein product [Chondrus crispus]CDF35813.1 unnamed protein product [Chondrus crispus]|eukprot:XP_005715632.1 unnamed protein product [Chondrus crispus]